jgi:hypothetical protein
VDASIAGEGFGAVLTHSERRAWAAAIACPLLGFHILVEAFGAGAGGPSVSSIRSFAQVTWEYALLKIGEKKQAVRAKY